MEDKDNLLTKDDLYEIEKVLDVHAGYINNEFTQASKIAIGIGGTDFDKKFRSRIKDNIKSLVDSRDRFKEIRDKLKKMRLSD